MIATLEIIFAVLTGVNANLALVGTIIGAGYEAFKKAKEALKNEGNEEPTLEQMHQKVLELRDPVDL